MSVNIEQSHNNLRLAKVAYVYPEAQTMDVIFLDTGDYCKGVQLMSHYGGTDFGFTSGLPRPHTEGWDQNKDTQPGRRDIVCVIAAINSRPICLGFLYPQVTQMAFKKEDDPDRMIERHPSDHYRTIDSKANFEQYHPGGAWFRMGEGIQHEDLTGKDFDGRWRLQHNGGTDPSITLWNQAPDGGYTRLTIDRQSFTAEVRDATGHKAASIQMVPGEVTIAATEKVVASAPLILEVTTNHVTTGFHTDARGHHTS